MHYKKHLGKRIVVMDIETASVDSQDCKGALAAITGRIVCICLLIDDGLTTLEIAIAHENERQILSEFWNELSPTDILVGHNILSFDIPFIRQRSWILGIKPSREIDTRKYYSADFLDTLEIWTNWGNKKGATLQALGAALGCGGKSADGSKVEDWWVTRNFQAIESYCREDVRLAYRIYCRLTYQEPKPLPPNVAEAEIMMISPEPSTMKDEQDEETTCSN